MPPDRVEPLHHQGGTIRPLRRVNAGCWQSRDGRWTFMRHWSDQQPQRWFAFHEDHPEHPESEGQGHTTLRDVAAWAETRP